MIKNADYFEKFEKKFIARSRISPKRAFRLFDAMWEEAAALGAMRRPKNALDGIEKNIEIARILNHVPDASR